MKRCLIAFIIILFFSTINEAEPKKGDIEISIFSGWSFLSAEKRDKIMPLVHPDIPIYGFGRKMNGSYLLGFKVGYYFTKKAEIEGSFAVAPSHELEGIYDCSPGKICPLINYNFFPYWFANVIAYHYDTNFLFNFNSNKITPFISAGIGGSSYDVGREFKTNFTFNFGIGIKYYIRGTGFRFEINEHFIPDHFLSGKNESNLQLIGAFLWNMSDLLSAGR